tara:strand:+ start:238 stop:1209 length:972 start_codon:yes stop_codon:yes gene_type:complete
MKNPLPRIVLAGCTGYIGRELAKILLGSGYSIICPVRNIENATKYISNHQNLILVNYQNLQETIEKSNLNPTILVSCIASRSGGVKDSWNVEYDANMKLLQLASKFQFKRFILLSAICVQKPLLEFQKAKLAFENELQTSSIPYDVIRPTAFFKSLSGQIERIKKGKSFLLFGNGDLTSCKPISERDLCRFIIRLIERKKQKSNIHIIGGPGPCITPMQQGRILFRLLKKREKFQRINPKIFLAIAWFLYPLSKVSSRLNDYREFLRIAYYYATESMLFWNSKIEEYDSNLTPEFGTDILEDFYKNLISRKIQYSELRDQKLF